MSALTSFGESVSSCAQRLYPMSVSAATMPGKSIVPSPRIVRVVLEVHFADPLDAEPADLVDDVEPLQRGVADVVVRQHGRRLRALHDAHVVARGDRVLEPEDHAGLLRLRPDLLEDVADVVHLLDGLQRAGAEERQQDDLDAHALRHRDGVGDALRPLRVGLQEVACAGCSGTPTRSAASAASTPPRTDRARRRRSSPCRSCCSG